MPSVVFDYAAWSERFPELASVSAGLAQSYFDEATLFLDNSDSSPVIDLSRRRVLLHLATAHIAALARNPGSVGRIKNAVERDVEVDTEFGDPKGSSAYWSQTQYGAQFWQATKVYRSATYVAGPQPYLGVPGVAGFGGYGYN